MLSSQEHDKVSLTGVLPLHLLPGYLLRSFPPYSMCDCICYPAMFCIAFGVPQGFEYLVKLLVLEIVSESAAKWE